MESKQLKFLVTEPNPDVLSIAVNLLIAMGHCAEGVQSWNEALDRIEKSEYDIVVTDFHRMGEPRNGYLFLRQVWALPGRSKQRAIVVTGFDPTRPNEPGAEDYHEIRDLSIPIVRKPNLTRRDLEHAIFVITHPVPFALSSSATSQ